MRGVLLVVGIFLLAGCSKAATGPEEDADFDAFGDFDLESADGKGAIRGVVVDPTIVPVRGATVEIQGNDVSIKSSKDGAFGFGNLTVGTYFLKVTKLGYFDATQQVVVEAGVVLPPIVKITLQPDASTLPYVIADQFVGFVACSMGGFSVCRIASPVGASNDQTRQAMQLDLNPLLIQSEMAWFSNQEVSDELWLWHTYGEDATGTGLAQGVFGQIQGASTLILTTDRASADAAGEVEAYDNLGREHDLVVAVFGGSLEESRLFCDQGYCGGVGFTFEQDFSVYTHAFYRYIPPEGWVFSRDGVPRP